MYSEEQKAKALCIYHRIGSVTDTVRRLGYPSREHLYTWIRNEGATKEKRKRLNLKNSSSLLVPKKTQRRGYLFVLRP